MPKKSSKYKPFSWLNYGAVPYYTARSLQRASLVILGLIVFLIYSSQLWFLLSSGVGTVEHYKEMMDNFAMFPLYNKTLIIWAGLTTIISLGLTFLLLIFPRVRRFERRIVVDGVVLSLVLFYLMMMSESAVRLFISKTIL